MLLIKPFCTIQCQSYIILPFLNVFIHPPKFRPPGQLKNRFFAHNYRYDGYSLIPEHFSNMAPQVSYVRIEAGKGRFAVWQVCDYIVTPRTIYHALAM